MPIYVYGCPKCGETVELLLKLREYLALVPPVCVRSGCDGLQEMRPQLQAAGIVLRGPGWTPKFAGGAAEGPSTDLVFGKKR